jgi:hypothetical protein
MSFAVVVQHLDPSSSPSVMVCGCVRSGVLALVPFVVDAAQSPVYPLSLFVFSQPVCMIVLPLCTVKRLAVLLGQL